MRPARAALLRERGLKVASPLGAFTVKPQLATTDTLDGGYDLVIVAAKQYDLDHAIDAIRPAVGPRTAVLPLLNGLEVTRILRRDHPAVKVLLLTGSNGVDFAPQAIRAGAAGLLLKRADGLELLLAIGRSEAGVIAQPRPGLVKINQHSRPFPGDALQRFTDHLMAFAFKRPEDVAIDAM